MKREFKKASGKRNAKPAATPVVAMPEPTDTEALFGISNETFTKGHNTHGEMVLAALMMRTSLESLAMRLGNRLSPLELMQFKLLETQATNIADMSLKLDERVRGIREHVSQQDGRLGDLAVIAYTDALTGVNNRRYFDMAGSQLLEQSKAEGQTAVAFVFDIDHFKSVNDTYGHDVGDIVLQIFARDLSMDLKKRDIFARYGGEEFAAILTGVTPEEASRIADRMRKNIAARPARLKQQPPIPAVTASIGVSYMKPDDTLVSLFKRADKALYLAKRSGRNRVCTETEVEAMDAVEAATASKAKAQSFRP